MTIITTSRFDLILRHDRMVTSKERTLTMHSSDCPYILYHVIPRTRRNQLAYIYLAKVSRLYKLRAILCRYYSIIIDEVQFCSQGAANEKSP